MKFFTRILFIFFLAFVLAGCVATLPPVELEGPFYCSPFIKLEDGEDPEKYQTEYYWKDWPESNSPTIREIGNSIISKTPVRKDYYFTFSENNFYSKDLYFRSRMEEDIVKTNLEPNEIDLIKQDDYYCSDYEISSARKEHSEILEKYSDALTEERSNIDKIRINFDKNTKLRLFSETDSGKIYTFLNQSSKIWKYIEGQREWIIEDFFGIYVPNKKDSPVSFIKDWKTALPLKFYTQGLVLESKITGRSNDSLTSRELIYNGRSGDTVKFLYREFTSEGMARSAFQQSVTYDLKIGEIIGFKGARFKILKADNVKLEYEVISPFFNPAPLEEEKN